jgi:anti-sigma B factor antagonist
VARQAAAWESIAVDVSGSAPHLPDEVGDLTLQSVRVGSRTVIAAAGEIDLITAERFEEAAVEALDAGALELWIDLSDVTFIDSSGLHALLAVRGHVAALERRFAVVCPLGPVRRALGIARLDEELELYTSRDEAHRSA